ncbi:hypothetical protein H5410_022459 [Solanum commersonii]|uniref:Uncharacterized protein n=1 Tax=Solanum commersonii TaxID=4109 RepID=A0A9J5ZEU6_SOLCO|nr:hypothetical protein H5410_022459 [Solanum commersonii]
MVLMQKYQSQKQQASNVQPATSMTFYGEHHFKMLKSSNFFTNFNELFQKYKFQIQQALDVQPVTLINFNGEHHLNVLNSTSPSSNDYSLNELNEHNELLELDNFDVEIISTKNYFCPKRATQDSLLKYRSQKQQAPNVQPATSMNFNGEHHFNVLNSSDFSTYFNELFQGPYIPQPPKFPFIVSSSSNDYSLN